MISCRTLRTGVVYPLGFRVARLAGVTSPASGEVDDHTMVYCAQYPAGDIAVMYSISAGSR